MSNKKSIEESLKRLILDDDRAFVAMLSGEWGIGKTYFWEEFSKIHLKDKDIVCISLFGQNSLDEIKENILTNLFQYNSFTKKYTKHLNTISGWISKYLGSPFNISAGSILSLFNHQDFKNTIICFDDFERLSDKVALKDVMGLISQFKEQKECKVIMILNEKELDKLSDIDGKKHDEIFALYKEKVVDYNFYYLPSQKELFEVIKEDIEKIEFCEPQIIHDFFKQIKLKNIRIMRQAVYQLSHFNFIKDDGLNKKVVNEFVDIALNLFVFKAKSNCEYSYFKEMIGYRTHEELEQDLKDMYEDISTETPQTKEPSDTYEKYKNDYLDLGFIYLKDELEIEIYNFLDTHQINNDKIHTLLKNKNSNIYFNIIHHKITNINLEYTHSFKYTDNEISEKLKNSLVENKEDIHKIFTYDKFNWFITNLEKYGNISLSSDDIKLIIKKYIEFYIDNPDSNDSHEHATKTYLENLIDEYDWATEYQESYLSSGLEKDITILPNIIADIRNERMYSDENKRHLELYSIEDFKKSIINAEPKYIDHIVHVCSWSISGNDFTPIKSKISSALTEISMINDEFKRKSESIAKHANITIEEEKQCTLKP